MALPQRQPGPDQRYTETAAAVQGLPHQRLSSKASRAPPAAPPIEAAPVVVAHPPAAATMATAVLEPSRQQQPHRTHHDHDDVLTTISSAPDAPAVDSSSSSSGFTALPTQEMWQKRFKHLPRGSKPVAFVGEGAANAVFEIKIPQHGVSDQNFKGRSFAFPYQSMKHEIEGIANPTFLNSGLLLRVAKVAVLGQPAAYNYLFQQKYYQTAIQPLLGHHAIHQELVILRGSGVVDELNRLLQDLDHTRKPKFRGSYVGLSDWGLLIEDMRPEPSLTSLPSSPCRGRTSSSSLLVEFKPKWLSQSRSAPAGAVRCRQCALELQRALTKPCGGGLGRFAPERKPCPLALVDEDAPSAVSSPFRIAPALGDTASAQERARLQKALERILRDPFLDDLRAQQEALDATGPLYASADDDKFGVAMTIRDCTCFALIPKDSQGADDIKIRLGDLDWKDPASKMQHWRGTEQALIDGGFYTVEWILCDGVYYHPPTLCLLEWRPRTVANSPPDVLCLRDASRTKNNGNGAAANSHVYTLEADTAVLLPKLQSYDSNDKALNPHRPQPH